MRNSHSTGDNNARPDATFTAVDTETGRQHKFKVTRKPQYKYPGGWKGFGMYELMRVLKADLTDAERRIAFWIPVISKRGDGPNNAVITGKKVEQELGVSKFSLSRAIPKLVLMGLIRRTDVRGLYLVNPEYSFSGSVIEHEYAKNIWYKVLDARPQLPETQEVA